MVTHFFALIGAIVFAVVLWVLMELTIRWLMHYWRKHDHNDLKFLAVALEEKLEWHLLFEIPTFKNRYTFAVIVTPKKNPRFKEIQ
jgi:hypothetical protein